MFELFNSLVKRLSWIDIKLVGFVGVGFGILLAKIGWFANIHWSVIVGIILLAYVKIIYSLFFNK